MANIWKPQRGSPLIKGHPLARGLAGCWLFNEGGSNKVYDISGYGNHGTLTNMTPDSDWVGSQQGIAVEYAGGNDHILIPTAGLNASEGTIILLMQPYFADDCGAAHYFWDSSGDRFTFYNDGFNNLTFTTGGAGRGAYYGWDLTPNDWYHVAFTWPSNLLYVNGVFENNYNDGDLASIGANLYLGSRVNQVSAFEGKYALLSFYDYELSPTEIAQLYADPYAFIDQGEMDWLRMLGAAAPPATKPYYYREFIIRGAA